MQAAGKPGKRPSSETEAASVILRNLLGARGKPEPFVERIARWRAVHERRATQEACPSTSASRSAPRGVYGTGRARSVKTHVAEPEVGSAAALSHTRGVAVAVRVRPLLRHSADAAALRAGDFEAVSSTSPGVTLSTGARREATVLHSCGVKLDGFTPEVEHRAFADGFSAHVARDATEAEVFDSLVAPLVRSAAVDGMKTSLICYGQTGSGKTHTLGHAAALAADYLFDPARIGVAVESVVVEAFELAGSVATSLLDSSRRPLSVLEDSSGVTRVGGSHGASHVTATRGAAAEADNVVVARSAAELRSVFASAAHRRSAQDTGRNAASSRSHAFYRVYVTGVRDGRAADCVAEGCLELVDLAGSENNKDSLYHDRERIDAAARINRSLMALQDCIRRRAEGASFVPYRADKLTLLLRSCFLDGAAGDKAQVVFLACVSPLASDTKQSLRTLSYAQQLATSKAAPHVKATSSPPAVGGAGRATTTGATPPPRVPEEFSRKGVSKWLRDFDNGRFSHLVEVFEWINGKKLASYPKEAIVGRCEATPGCDTRGVLEAREAFILANRKAKAARGRRSLAKSHKTA